MISLSKKIIAITRARRLDTKDLIRGIRDIGYQISLESSIPLIADLRMN